MLGYGYDGTVLVAVFTFVVVLSMRTFAPEVYDALICKMTGKW